MIKTDGRLVCHARRPVFQLAETVVRREILAEILERISRLGQAPLPQGSDLIVVTS